MILILCGICWTIPVRAQVSCPSSVVTVVSQNDCGTKVNGISLIGGTADNYTLSGATQGTGTGDADGLRFNVGTTEVLYTYSGGSCDFKVTIEDNIAPVITCPSAPAPVNTAPNSCTVNCSISLPAVSDNCDVSQLKISYTVKDEAGNQSSPVTGAVNYPFKAGENTVTYTVSDEAGNTSSCPVTVIVKDIIPPSIACPSVPASIETDLNSCTAAYSISLPTVSDNCDVSQLKISYTVKDKQGNVSPSATGAVINYPFKIGDNLVTYTVSDQAGNNSTCTMTVKVQDTQEPSVTCPSAPQTLDTDPNSCNATYSLDLPVVSDNCDVSLSISHTIKDVLGNISSPVSGAVKNYPFKVGNNLVTYTVSDQAGNSNTCSVTVPVQDIQKPTISCPPAPPVINTAPASCTAQHSLPLPTVSDNCSLSQLKISYTVTNEQGDTSLPEDNAVIGYPFSAGDNVVTYTVTDASGNTNTCTVDVKVKDNQLPTITCPAVAPEANTDDASCTYECTLPLPAVSDNCDASQLKITYTVADNEGSISGPFDGAVNGYLLDVGNNQITYIVTDKAGNSASCVIPIRVKDDQAPTITCPAKPPVLNTDIDVCTARYSIPLPVVSDNCDIARLKISYTVEDETGAVSPSFIGAVTDYQFKLGDNNIMYTVTDEAGNTNSCGVPVLVVDNQKPEIECPADIVAQSDSGTCIAVRSIPPKKVSDNCTPDSELTIKYHILFADLTELNGEGTVTDQGFPAGVSTITYSVEDKSGNESDSCSFTITVEDKEKPTVICPQVPANIPADKGTCTAKRTFRPEVSDNCPGELMITYTISDLNDAGLVHLEVRGFDSIDDYEYPVGTTQVKCVAKDAAGNVSDPCIFNVTVLDLQIPVITCPSVPAEIPTDAGACTATRSFSPATCTDNCTPADKLILHYTIEEPDHTVISNSGALTILDNYVYKTGKTQVSYYAADSSGNHSLTCSFEVNVVDKEAPSVVCPAIPSDIATDPGKCFSEQNYLPVITDNCTPVTDLIINYTVTHPDRPVETGTGVLSNYKYYFGVTTVTYVVADTAGNESSCQFTVSVIDTEVPEITPPVVPAEVQTDLDMPYATCSFLPDISDNCTEEPDLIVHYTIERAGAAPVTGQGLLLNHKYYLGITKVILWVEDKSGNKSDTCSYKVKVVDKQKPYAFCKAIDVYLDPLTGEANINPKDLDNGSWDNCTSQADLIFSVSKSHFDCADIGPNTVILTVTDTCNNSGTCSTTVTVKYHTDPAPAVNPLESEICFAGTTNLELTNPGFESVMEWIWTATGQSGAVTGYSGGSSSNPGYIIAQQLSNSSDIVQTVTYKIAPKVYNKCMLAETTSVVWVNPQPRLVIKADTSICNLTLTRIASRTSSVVSSHASVYYSWTTTGTANINGYSNSGTDSGVNIPIEQLLDNTSLQWGEVDYSLTPSLYLNGNVCPSPYVVTHKVIVEPTPVIQVTAQDTICNNTKVNFNVATTNQPKGIWQFNGSSTIPSDVTVPEPIVLHVAGSFPQTINNNSFEKQSVGYSFSPMIITPHGYGCLNPDMDTTTIVAVNPTPVMEIFLLNAQDSICYDQGTSLSMTTRNRNIIGDMKYDLYQVNYSAGNVSNVALTGLYEFIDLDQTTLVNTSNAVQKVEYLFKPVIEYRHLTCSGSSMKENVYIAPVVDYNMVAKQYIGGNNIRCYGDDDGEIDVKSVIGGWAGKGYEYVWNITGVSGDKATGLKASVTPTEPYTVTVYDKIHGCNTTKNILLTQPDALTLGSSTEIENPDCKGPTGSITLAVEGGVRGYKYEWGPPPFTWADSSAVNLMAGSYDITITDTLGCEKKEIIVLSYDTGTAIPQLNWYETTYKSNGLTYNVSCFGASDGMLNPYITYPSTVMTYEWVYLADGTVVGVDSIPDVSLGWPDFKIMNLKAGKYELTVTNDQGCMYSAEITLSEPDPITFDSLVHQYSNGYQVECYNGNSGKIDISNVAGAYHNYEYIWNPVSGGIVNGVASQENLAAGTYELIIRSFVGSGIYCSDTASFKLNQPPKVNIVDQIPLSNGYAVACFGDNSGQIDLSVSGGYGTYEYSWSSTDGIVTSPQSKDQHNLVAGTYDLEFTYDGTCVEHRTYTLTQPPRIKANEVISLYTNTSVKCKGDKNGFIQVNPTGGVSVPGYNYTWQSPDHTITSPNNKDQNNLGAGDYWLVIKDGNNCVFDTTFVLSEPEEIKIITIAEDMSCIPGNDGYINLEVSGGNPSYNYVWSNGATTSDISGLVNGNYVVVVTDANGCTATANADIHIPSPLIVTAIVVSDYNGFGVDCYGNQTGRIKVDVLNGRGGYTYQWTPGGPVGTSEVVAKAGTYHVLVEDKFKCTGLAQVTLTQPEKIRLQVATTDVTCPGDDDGVINLLTTGGYGNYRYVWSNGYDLALVPGLTAGKYDISVIDDNQCKKDTSIVLSQPNPIQVQFITVDAYCPDINDGQIQTSVTGGNGPYTYLWKELQISSPHLSDVKSGEYTLLVTDSRGCKQTEKVELGYASDACLHIPNAFSPNDDGANDRWEIMVGDPDAIHRYQLREIYPDAIVEVFSANWGLLLFRSQKGYPEPWDGKYHGKYLPVNSYLYVIRLNDKIKPIVGNVTIIR